MLGVRACLTSSQGCRVRPNCVQRHRPRRCCGQDGDIVLSDLRQTDGNSDSERAVGDGERSHGLDPRSGGLGVDVEVVEMIGRIVRG